jgi:hypothetical protein
MLFVSVTHGFSQVFGVRELGRNRLKGFSKHRAKLAARLKPGVNEKGHSTFEAEPFNDNFERARLISELHRPGADRDQTRKTH